MPDILPLIERENGMHIDTTRIVTPIEPVTVARTVHYVSYGSKNGEYTPEHRAAIVTAVGVNDCVSLCVLNPTGIFFNEAVEYDRTGTISGTWHWPE